jgi:FAD/FMN-containing dehydrogenase
MGELTVKSRTGGEVALGPEVIDRLRSGLRGSIVRQGEPGYDPARAIWNAMIDRRPAMIARCAGAADVIRCVRFAREHDLLLAVRGGGHNIAGDALCDGGLVIDLSMMRGVRVDPRARTAQVDAGATLGDFDGEAQAFGLATPLGINSTTGVAGLTLGGGFGWLSRKYGLTVDNLKAADVVTADGELVRATAKREPDLFWALRGGGGNFGVVTSFEFALHRVGPEVTAGLIVHRLEDAQRVLGEYRELAAAAPDDVGCWLLLRKAPPLPFIPSEFHGREVLVLAAICLGSTASAARKLAPFRRIGKPVADAVGPHRFVDWQHAFDPLLTPGARNYWKSHNFESLSDDVFAVMLDFAGRLPTPHTEIFLGQLGGAAGRVPVDATAYPHRNANFVMNVHARWEERADDARCVAWSRQFFEAAAPFATGGVYVNFISQGEDRVAAAFGANYERLAALKRRWDPTNLFSVNQNVRPRVAVEERPQPQAP